MSNNKGYPYAWGNIMNGRCGIKIENENNNKHNDAISKPTAIRVIKNFL
jgi:hypothetical protein